MTFDHLRDEPKVPPRQDISAEDLVKARRQLAQQQGVMWAKVQEQRAAAAKKWEAIPVDDSTAKGFLRVLARDAAKGDLAAVRRGLASDKANAGPALDLHAQYMVSWSELHALAVKRFGQATIDKRGMALEDWDGEFSLMQWADDSNGGVRARFGWWVKKEQDGHYRLYLPFYMGPPEPMESAMKSEKQQLEKTQKIVQILKSNPNMTLDELLSLQRSPVR